jgi:hypothetical protein
MVVLLCRCESGRENDMADDKHPIIQKDPVIRAMKVGDWECLALYLEHGGDIDAYKGLRRFIAGILRGETKRSANRIPKMATERRQYAIAQMAAGGRVEEAMRRFNVDRRTVRRAVQAYERALKEDPHSIIGHWLFQVRAGHNSKR